VVTTTWGTSSDLGIDPSRLWEFLTSETNDANWRGPWLRSVRLLSDGPVGVGTRFTVTGAIASPGWRRLFDPPFGWYLNRAARQQHRQLAAALRDWDGR
jgi:hypothetical protein